MRSTCLVAATLMSVHCAFAAPCDLSGYREQSGLRAESVASGVRLTWTGAGNQDLRAEFGMNGGSPVIAEIAAQTARGWSPIARNLRPEYEVTTGVRRISEQQLAPLRELGIAITPELVEREKWNAFWDAPLEVPGRTGTNPGLPRKPEEIRRGSAKFANSQCTVKTEGSRIEVSFDGLTLGIFTGRLQFTVYKGTNLIRQEAVARTEEPSVAYKYQAGLSGFETGAGKRVLWRDTARAWQKYEFGGALNQDPVALRARSRTAIVETGSGSVAVFPPPHKFFFAREIELNLGYVWYRKDAQGNFAVGIRHGDHEEMYRPHGVSDEVWDRRTRQSRGFAKGNFALYNAPPGTWQRMAMYLYVSPEEGRKTNDAVMAFTHDDTFKPIPGYQVTVSHFHTHFHEYLEDAGSLDTQPPWVPVFRALGINIAMMSDFHSDGHPNDPGPVRYAEQKTYFGGCMRHSDSDFLLMPGEEPDAYMGGHYTMVFPRPVYWTKVRKPGQPFVEQDPKYGKVYHIGSRADELQMLKQEQGLMWQAHPRTKGSTFYPDAIRETEHFRSDRFLGGSYQSLPADQSQARLCEKRCLDLLDDMNNWGGPKYMIAEGDTYAKFPSDDTFSHLIVNYVKLARLPRFDEDWTPVLAAMRAGDFFVTSGEVLIPSWRLDGTGASRKVIADVEWTFPPEFVEVVWGDGTVTGRQVVKATDQPAFGKQHYEIPFDAAGRKWVRFAAWDSAGNGAITQPVHLR